MPIREGFHTVTPYLTTHDPDGLVRFMTQAFGATETLRGAGGGGGVHLEVRVGDSMVMVGGLTNPEATSQTGMFYLYVDDPDGWHARALEAGASSIMDPADMPDGERRGGARDPLGNLWFFGRPATG